MSNNSRQVVAVALPEVVAFDLSTVAQVFGYRDEDDYEFRVTGREAGQVTTSTGFSIAGVCGPEAIGRAHTVVIPGFNSVVETTDPLTAQVLEELCAAHRSGTRIVSICTGAFALAAAGLLDGRRATTHWQRTAELARDFPRIDVDPGVLYVDDGDIATSAGVAAGIDLSLHLVRKDLGEEAATRIARRMVVAPHRGGGQAQFIEHPTPGLGSGLAAVTEWMTGRLAEPLTTADCASRAGMSLRHFQRRFTAELGVSPARWLNQQRIHEARRLLERTNLTVDAVAHRTGLGTAANLRRHFTRELGVSPTAYRATFGGMEIV